MSTPKPGQIRCPTCLRSTPPAAYCTQCGSPIPQSARSRPRGLDRDELEERVRRRPGEGAFRRGAPLGDEPARAGYVPYEPEPEDHLAIRPEQDQPRYSGAQPPETEQTGRFEPPADPEAVAPEEGDEAGRGEQVHQEPGYEEPGYQEPESTWPEQDYAEPYDDRPYGQPEDAYAYPYAGGDDRGGGGALPIIGFVVLCVLALAVGAVLAGLLTGEDEVGQPTPSPTVAESLVPSTESPAQESVAPSEPPASATPDPTDGPVTFPDGAVYTLDVCATGDFTDDLSGCQVDGSTVDNGDVWVLVVFEGAQGADNLEVQLRSGGETLLVEEKQLGSVVNCNDPCRGLIYGAVYRDLLPGDYQLVLRRNGDFADGDAFTVEG